MYFLSVAFLFIRFLLPVATTFFAFFHNAVCHLHSYWWSSSDLPDGHVECSRGSWSGVWTEDPKDRYDSTEYSYSLTKRYEYQILDPVLRACTGEWTITADCFVKPLVTLEYHKYLTDGQLLWHQRVPRTEMRGRMEEIFVNPFCFNDTCRRGWLAAEKHLAPIARAAQGAGVLPDIEPDRQAFLQFLSKPEAQWRPLFGNSTKLMQKNDGFIMMSWLCKEGILLRYNPVGSVLMQPQIMYGPTDLPRKGSRTQMTRADEGVAYLTNIWGTSACQGAHLFEILKRVRDPLTGQYTHFAAVPYASMSKVVPTSVLEYRGVSGGIEYGAAFYRGRVLDVLGTPPSGDLLLLIQGLRGSASESYLASNHAPKLKVLMASAERVI